MPTGRPKGSTSKYNFHSETRAKFIIRRSLKNKQKTIKRLKNTLNGLWFSFSTWEIL